MLTVPKFETFKLGARLDNHNHIPTGRAENLRLSKSKTIYLFVESTLTFMTIEDHVYQPLDKYTLYNETIQ
jgi:hypothetical protein